MNPLRIWLRRLKTLMWTALTLIAVLSAILVGIGKLLMPYSARYQPQLEAWLSQEFQQPVRLARFTGEWRAFGPQIRLEGLTLHGAGAQAIAIQHAALDIRPLNAVLPGRPLYSFRIIGADLSLVRNAEARFELSGLGVSGRGGRSADGSAMSSLATFGEVVLEQSRLSFTDELRGVEAQLTAVNGRLQMEGRRFSVEVEADISDPYDARVLGDLKATLLITLDREQRLQDAEWHVKTGELMLSELARQLPPHPLVPASGWLNAELWGTWSPASDQVMQGVLDLREVHLPGGARALQLDHLNSRFRWNFISRKSWRLDLSELQVKRDGAQWSSPRMTVARNVPGNLGIWVSSEFIDLEFPLQLTQRALAHYSTRWPSFVPRQARGVVRDFELVLDGAWKLQMTSGEFERLDAWDWGRWPAIAGASGSIDLRGGEGQLSLSGQQVRIDWPGNFRRPAIVNIEGCTLEIVWGLRWQTDVRDCRLRNEDLALRGRARFVKSEGRPRLDINVAASEGSLGGLQDYWPERVMRPNVTQWLRRGLAGGRIDAARFSMTGDMDDWPFRQGEGSLEAVVEFSDADLDYYAGWPRAGRVSGRARFQGTSMEVLGRVGTLAGVPVQEARARISDFSQPVLAMEYRSEAALPTLLGFIGATPLLEDVDLDLQQFDFQGPARTTGVLEAPLKAGAGPIRIEGQLELAGNDFRELQSGVVIEDIQGTVAYDREGLRAEGLQARYQGRDASLALMADWDAPEVFRAGLQGMFSASEVIPATVLQGEPLLADLQGECRWNMGLVVGQAGADAAREIWLQMGTDLVGVELDLPAPLDKPPEAAWPLQVRYPVKSAEPVFLVRLHDRLSLQFDVADGISRPRRASIQLGPRDTGLPEAGFFSLGGQAEHLDLDRWMRLISERLQRGRAVADLAFRAADLHVDELVLLNRLFPDVELEVHYQQGTLSSEFDSPKLSGLVRYSQPPAGPSSLTAELDRLLLPPAQSSEAMLDTDPSRLPELHLYVREFAYLGLDLGETRIEAYPIQDGFRFDPVTANSAHFNFQARGDWIATADGARSDFNIVITSESLGALMDAMDISSVLEGGQTMVRYDAWWPGPPAAFALARLNGEIGFSVTDGTIRSADPGAGRMLGLMSVAALPRRLALDFRDVFGTGFSFDQASGTVRLENGHAHTDNTVLESTAATLSIVGSSDLVAKRFDYMMTVRPGVGQTLPVIGAIAGGPGGAAAGLALQGLLQKSLGDAAEARYALSGPWQEPVVERLEVEARVEAKEPNEQ
ncbi:MAG: TIGR02099 family protein [Xanthomonadales bacterium]|nr:TIGR02099 family protein [Xanthomonadales bacterium]NIN59400.1 TIGR02099 family protein [Xanthomonadales bacterium]NIN74751.1 TIGR02099 family protein [Xanthomonadales bacterium]NIO14887.1 TIGR02099 family protein [Xanthomonadales bacterium]NIP11793.1 TIGR02099 family protein [Xanthomonadales bacterium]